MKASDEGYQAKKEKLIEAFASSYDDTRPWSLNKTTSNLFRPRVQGEKDRPINLKTFNKVIKVDKDSLIVEVEGLTTYEDLVSETLKHSCLPTVVPELKTITVGGAIAGCGIESSSFRHGLVHESVLEMDVLLGDGKVVTCAADNGYLDLFTAIPNTFGTLGYILRAVIKLVHAKKYVKLSHIRFSSPQGYFECLSDVCRDNRKEGKVSYVDGVIFNPNEMVLTLGESVDSAPFISRYDSKDIYYLSLKEKDTDYLTASDYIWRWDADWFWCSRVFFMQNPLMRRLFGRWMLHSGSYSKIMHFFNRHPRLKRPVDCLFGKKESVIQDACIPIQNAEKFLEFFHPEIGIRPIWVCPAHCQDSTPQFDFCPLKKNELYIDFGFWDTVPSDKAPGFYNRKIEQEVKRLGGFKSLYSSSFYTEGEFWELYDREKYQQLKKKYDSLGHLKSFYEKCVNH
jgi:FAD/FMN-containing dehydrogenase